jgi:hypothetical protein
LRRQVIDLFAADAQKCKAERAKGVRWAKGVGGAEEVLCGPQSKLNIESTKDEQNQNEIPAESEPKINPT